MAATTSTVPSLSLFNPFHKEGRNLTDLLNRCETTRQFKQIHGKFLKLGVDPNSTLFRQLLKSSANLGHTRYTHTLFHQIGNPSYLDRSILIKAYSNSNFTTYVDHTITLFLEMQQSGFNPDTSTISSVLKACAKNSKVSEGTQIHGLSFKLGFQRSTHIQNSLINMYCSFGDVEKFRLTFDQLGDDRDDDSWKHVIAYYRRKNMWNKCLETFREMRTEFWRVGETNLENVLSTAANLRELELGRCVHCALLRNSTEIDVVIQHALVKMYSNCGRPQTGMMVFRRMPRRYKWVYIKVLGILCSSRKWEEALGVFREMLEEGVKPNKFVCLMVLSCYRYAGLLEDAVRFFEEMRSKLGVQPKVGHYWYILNAMCDSGELRRAFQFIENSPFESLDSMWQRLLGACAARGEDELVKMVTEKLLELKRKRMKRIWKWSDEEYVLVGTVKMHG